MAENEITLNPAVTAFLNHQPHPLRAEIELLRACTLAAEPTLAESIKWNGPNYSLNNQDRITMKIQPPKNIQLIFHRGAKKQQQPATRLIAPAPELLVWKENDRAIATFKTCAEIETHRVALTAIIKAWLQAAN